MTSSGLANTSLVNTDWSQHKETHARLALLLLLVLALVLLPVTGTISSTSSLTVTKELRVLVGFLGIQERHDFIPAPGAPFQKAINPCGF